MCGFGVVVLFGLISRFLEYGDFSVAASDGFVEGVEYVLAEVVEVAVRDVDEAGVVVFVELVAEAFNQRLVLFVEGSGYSGGFACDSVNHCFVFFIVLVVLILGIVFRLECRRRLFVGLRFVCLRVRCLVLV